MGTDMTQNEAFMKRLNEETIKDMAVMVDNLIQALKKVRAIRLRFQSIKDESPRHNFLYSKFKDEEQALASKVRAIQEFEKTFREDAKEVYHERYY